MRSGRGRTELVDRRLQVTDHKKYGVEFWDELLLGADMVSEQDIPIRWSLRSVLRWLSTAGGFRLRAALVRMTWLHDAHSGACARFGQTSVVVKTSDGRVCGPRPQVVT